MRYLAITDQLIVSGARFALSVTAARLLGVEEFGIYALLWTIVTLSGGMQLPVVIAPMMQMGARAIDRQGPSFFGYAFLVQIGYHLCSALVVTAAVCLLMWRRDDLIPLIIATNIYVIAYNQWEFVRRYLYTRAQYRKVLAFDLILYGGVGAAVVPMYLNSASGITGLLFSMAAPACVLSICTSARFVRIDVRRRRVIATARKMWRISAPLVIASTASVISANVYIYASAIVLGPSVVGGIAAARNLFGPLAILFMAIENTLIREAVLTHSREPRELRSLLTSTYRSWSAGIVAFTIFAVMLDKEILQFVYGNSFPDYSELVAWFAVAHAIQFITKVQAVGLRAKGEFYTIKSANIAAMWACSLVAFPAVHFLGLTGVMLCVLLQQGGVLWAQTHPLRLDRHLELFPIGRVAK